MEFLIDNFSLILMQSIQFFLLQLCIKYTILFIRLELLKILNLKVIQYNETIHII